jgi:hypothetical protein
MILIFGLPRSGTTWLGKLFDSHPDTLYRHEPDSVHRDPTLPLLPEGDLDGARARLARDYVRRVLAVRTSKVVGRGPLFHKSYLSPLANGARGSAVIALKLAERAGWRAARRVQIPDLSERSLNGAVLPVWKSIESVGRLGLFVRAVEGARGILIIRHPCGQIASVLRGEAKRRFENVDPSSEDVGFFALLAASEPARRRGLTLERLKAMAPLERLAWRWALLNEKALADIEGLPQCVVVRYEDLCREPEATLRRLFAFAGLAWNAQSERFASQTVAEEDGGDYYSVFKDPLAAASRWRDELAPQDQARIAATVRDSLPGRLFAAELPGA